MTGVSITVNGSDEVLRSLQTAIEATSNPEPLYDEIGASLVVSTQRRFEDGRDPEGNPWPPSLRALVEGGQTLVDSARLKGSITHEASSSGVAVGTNVLYAAIHQVGGVITAKTEKGLVFKGVGDQWVRKQSVTIPARPFLGVDDEDEAEIEAIATDWLASATGGEAAP